MAQEQRNDMSELEQRKKDYVETFTTPQGKRVLVDLERQCFVHKTTYDDNSNKMAWREGARFVVGVHIKNMLDMNINRLKKLIGEEK